MRSIMALINGFFEPAPGMKRVGFWRYESASIGTNHRFDGRAVRAPSSAEEAAMLAAWDRRRAAVEMIGLRHEESWRADLRRLELVDQIVSDLSSPEIHSLQH